jgi:hypothetical protein
VIKQENFLLLFQLSTMQKRFFITVGIILLILNSVLSQSNKEFSRKYSFNYTEKILSDYSNLLEKADRKNFKETENEWKGNFSIANQNFFQFSITNSSGRFDSLAVIPISIRRKNLISPIEEICYSFYPGKEQDALIRNVLTAVQYFKPDKILFNNPQSEEDYVDGQFNIHYELLQPGKTGDFFLFKKSKIQSQQHTISLNKIIIDSFYCRVSYDRIDSTLKSFELIEIKHQKVGDRILAYIKTVLNIENKLSENDTKIFDKKETDNTVCTEIHKTFSRKDRKIEISRNVLKNTSTDQLLKLVQNDSVFVSKDQHELISKLRSALFLFPEFFNQLKNYFDTTANNSKRYSVLMSAILSSESVTAQKYLANLLEENSQNYSLLKGILPSMGIMTYLVDSSLLSALARLLYSQNEDISFLAGLTLSNMANQLKFSDTVQYKIVNKILFEHYLASGISKENTLQYLKEIGNSGDEERIQLLIPLLKTTDEEIKMTAVSAFKFILIPKADTLLSDMLINYASDSLLTAQLYEPIRLRFPSSVIRQSIYYLLKQNTKNLWPAKKQFIYYLKFYADELPSLSSELKAASIEDQQLNTELNELRSWKKWFENM